LLTTNGRRDATEGSAVAAAIASPNGLEHGVGDQQKKALLLDERALSRAWIRSSE